MSEPTLKRQRPNDSAEVSGGPAAAASSSAAAVNPVPIALPSPPGAPPPPPQPRADASLITVDGAQGEVHMRDDDELDVRRS